MSTTNPPEALEQRVFLRIREAQVARARARLAIFGFGAVTGLFLSLPAYQYAMSELTTSGFLSYASLLLSDSGMLMLYWKEFGLTLLESLPVFGILLFGTAVLVFFGMLRLAAKNFDGAFMDQQFA